MNMTTNTVICVPVVRGQTLPNGTPLPFYVYDYDYNKKRRTGMRVFPTAGNREGYLLDCVKDGLRVEYAKVGGCFADYMNATAEAVSIFRSFLSESGAGVVVKNLLDSVEKEAMVGKFCYKTEILLSSDILHADFITRVRELLTETGLGFEAYFKDDGMFCIVAQW